MNRWVFNWRKLIRIYAYTWKLESKWTYYTQKWAVVSTFETVPDLTSLTRQLFTRTVRSMGDEEMCAAWIAMLNEENNQNRVNGILFCGVENIRRIVHLRFLWTCVESTRRSDMNLVWTICDANRTWTIDSQWIRKSSLFIIPERPASVHWNGNDLVDYNKYLQHRGCLQNQWLHTTNHNISRQR